MLNESLISVVLAVVAGVLMVAAVLLRVGTGWKILLAVGAVVGADELK